MRTPYASDLNAWGNNDGYADNYSVSPYETQYGTPIRLDETPKHEIPLNALIAQVVNAYVPEREYRRVLFIMHERRKLATPNQLRELDEAEQQVMAIVGGIHV